VTLSIALAGSGSLTEKNAYTLLDDFIGSEGAVFFGPNYVTQEQESLRTILGWYPYMKVRKGKLIETLAEHDEPVFMVLSTEGLEDLIGQAQRAGVPVLDLCRGLFQVTEALDGVESNANELSQTPEGDQPQDESDLVRIDPSASDPWAPDEYMTRAQVEELIMTVIQVHETRYHNGVKVETTVVRPEPEEFNSLPSEATIQTPNYYKSKTGKLRPMGRSKARPGETPVYLTQEEINALG
jgi:hypothetical protein